MKKYKDKLNENLSRNKAVKIDADKRGRIEVYTEMDLGTYNVFGLNSGFSYANFSSESDAIDYVNNNPQFILV